MKKILFVSPRNPFSGRYSGDVVRANKFVNFLSRNNYVKVISPHFKNSTFKKSKISYEGFKDTNFITKIYFVFLSMSLFLIFFDVMLERVLFFPNFDQDRLCPSGKVFDSHLLE